MRSLGKNFVQDDLLKVYSDQAKNRWKQRMKGHCKLPTQEEITVLGILGKRNGGHQLGGSLKKLQVSQRRKQTDLGPAAIECVDDVWQLCQSFKLSSAFHLFSIPPEESEAAWSKRSR